MQQILETYSSASGYTAGASPIRGVIHEALTPSTQDVLSFIEIASEGNATDFGDLVSAKYASCGISTNTRGVFGGDSSRSTTVQFITIASKGDASDYADLTVGRSYLGGTSAGEKVYLQEVKLLV